MLIVLVVPLLLTLGAFFAGWINYPVGILVLTFLIAGRAIHLRRRDL